MRTSLSRQRSPACCCSDLAASRRSRAPNPMKSVSPAPSPASGACRPTCPGDPDPSNAHLKLAVPPSFSLKLNAAKLEKIVSRAGAREGWRVNRLERRAWRPAHAFRQRLAAPARAEVDRLGRLLGRSHRAKPPTRAARSTSARTATCSRWCNPETGNAPGCRRTARRCFARYSRSSSDAALGAFGRRRSDVAKRRDRTRPNDVRRFVGCSVDAFTIAAVIENTTGGMPSSAFWLRDSALRNSMNQRQTTSTSTATHEDPAGHHATPTGGTTPTPPHTAFRGLTVRSATRSPRAPSRPSRSRSAASSADRPNKECRAAGRRGPGARASTRARSRRP
jgi:hypothetical protein